jgi:hypothetical protein
MYKCYLVCCDVHSWCRICYQHDYYARFVVFEIAAFIISMSIGYLRTMMTLIAGVTFNRNTLPEFVLKMSEIDNHLFRSKQTDVYNKQYKSC